MMLKIYFMQENVVFKMYVEQESTYFRISSVKMQVGRKTELPINMCVCVCVYV